MNNNCYMDGAGLLDRYGMIIPKGGYNDLLAFPSLKEPNTESWPEEDGVDVDLSAPTLNARDINIPFLSLAAAGRYMFLENLSTPGYHAFYIPSLDREWSLRLASEASLKSYGRLDSFTLGFMEDIFTRPNPDTFNPGLPIRPSRYELDGVPFHEYGIMIEEASDSVLISASAKMNQNREVKTRDGRIYDADLLVFDSKEVRFKCLLKAVSKEAFWSCYDAFLAALTAPGLRELYVDYESESFSCYYRSASSWRIVQLSPMLVEFTLTLVFTSFRVNGGEYILASEAGDIITTETDDFAIDLLEIYGN